MISTAPTPSPLASNPSQSDLSVSGNSDSMLYVHQDANSPSFASHMNYQITQRAPQSPTKTRPSTTVMQPDSTTANSQKAHDSNAPASSTPAADVTSDSAGADSSTQASASTATVDSYSLDSSREKLSRDKTTRQVTGQTPLSADLLPVPLLASTLAITNSIAPLPLPAAPGPIAATLPDANASGSNTGTSALLNGLSALAPLVSAVPNPAAGMSGSAQPLTTPGVSMDSRTASPIAVPGVANALPQSSTLTPAPASLLLRSLNSSGSSADNPGSAGDQSAIPPVSLALPPVVGAPLANPAAANPANPTSSDLTAATGAAVQPNPLQLATTLPGLVQTPSGLSHGQATPLNVNGSIAMSPTNPAAQIAASEPNSAGNKAAASTPNASASAQNLQDKQPDTGIQHLEGIERLLTLGANKTAAASAGITGEPSARLTGRVQTNITANMPSSVPFSALSSLSSVHGLSAEIPDVPANALASQTAANADNPDPNLSLMPATLLNTGTVAMATEGALGSMQDIRDVSGGLHPLPGQTMPGEFSSTGFLTGAVSAHGQSSSAENSDQGERQSDTPEHTREEASTGTNGTANTSVGAANLTGNATRLDDASGTAAASTSALNGSGQIDRANVIAQVTQHLESMRLTEGSGELRVHLAPEHLGNVQITVTSHADGLVARIAVESAQVQQVMDGAKEHLRSTLEARGLHVDSVEVSVLPTMTGNSNMASNGQHNGYANSDYAEGRTNYGRTSTVRAQPIDTSPTAQTAKSPARSATSRLDYLA